MCIYLATTFSLCVCDMYVLHTCLRHFVVVMWRIPVPFSTTNAVCIAIARRCHMCVGFACLVCLLGAFVAVVIAAASSHTNL